MTNTQAFELIGILGSLPADKVDEVTDFAKFLKQRYAKNIDVDISDEWTDEDYADASRASMQYGYTGLEDEE